MMMNSAINAGQGGRHRLRWATLVWVWVVVCLAVGWTTAWAQEVKPQPVLQAVDIGPLPGNRLQLRFRLSERPEGPPSSFTINEPARIVLDFLGTRNEMTTRQQAINVGVADKLSVLEGADRTRASLNLSRLVPYQVQVQGNSVLLTLESAGTAVNKPPAPTPSGTVAASAPKRTEAPASSKPGKVSDVSFKRGPEGQGIITVKLSHSNIAADVRQEGNRIVADFQGATLPKGQQQRLDVTDFATPVTKIEALNQGNNARLSIEPSPPFEYLAYQANDLYVIEVRPPQIAKTEDRAEIEVKALREELEREATPTGSFTGDPLSLNFQDIEVRAILQILADFTGKNIVVSDKVTGNLTLRLQNVPWDQALDIILRLKGLAKQESGNVLFIAPTEEVTTRNRQTQETIAAKLEARVKAQRSIQELTPLRTEVLEIKYASADKYRLLILGLTGETKTAGTIMNQGGDVKAMVKEDTMLSSRGVISVDDQTNSLIITDEPVAIERIRKMVAILDRPARQVMIDSRIVIAGDDFSRDLGVKFGVSGVSQTGDRLNALGGKLEGTDAIVGSAVGNLNTTGQPFPVAVPELTQRLGVNLPVAGPSLAFAILGADYLVDLELSALQSEGKGEVVSNPRVVTANQQKATISQGRQIPYSTVSQEGTNVEFKEALLKLEVTPHITPDDRVKMKLVVEKNEQGATVATATGPQVSIDTRKVETELMVNNGETVVLGGVFEQTKRNDVSKVPFLGDIPLMGYLFRNTTASDTKRELLIFVTPQILKEGTGADR